MLPADMMNDSISTQILINTPALMQNFVPVHETFDDEWTPLTLAIQRGRDHGIPAYHKALNLCEARLGLSKDSKLSFDDIEFVGISPERREVLEKIYQ